MGGASSSEGAIPKGMKILAEIKPGYEEILSRDALDFLAKLSRKYSGRVSQLLEQRREQQARFDAGEKPAFLAETKKIREGDWKVAPLPADFQDRRVEITGPTDRKMVINALNSGANVYMPDFEDSNCPTWDNMVQGQINLRDAVRGTVSFEDPHTGKEYALKEGKRAIMVCRPRGWHLWEHHVLVDGQAVPGERNCHTWCACFGFRPEMASGCGAPSAGGWPGGAGLRIACHAVGYMPAAVLPK
jgi:malate synthase